MPPVQTTYSENIAAAVAGQLADMTDKTLVSRTVETEAGIGFGLPVAQGAGDHGVIAYAGADYFGITVRDRSVNPATPNLFAENDTARILRRGAIWVEVSVAVEAGDQVYITDAGEFTNVEGSNFAIPDARFDTSAAQDALAVVRIN